MYVNVYKPLGSRMSLDELCFERIIPFFSHPWCPNMKLRMDAYKWEDHWKSSWEKKGKGREIIWKWRDIAAESKAYGWRQRKIKRSCLRELLTTRMGSVGWHLQVKREKKLPTVGRKAVKQGQIQGMSKLLLYQWA